MPALINTTRRSKEESLTSALSSTRGRARPRVTEALACMGQQRRKEVSSGQARNTITRRQALRRTRRSTAGVSAPTQRWCKTRKHTLRRSTTTCQNPLGTVPTETNQQLLTLPQLPTRSSLISRTDRTSPWLVSSISTRSQRHHELSLRNLTTPQHSHETHTRSPLTKTCLIEGRGAPTLRLSEKGMWSSRPSQLTNRGDSH